MWMDVAPYGLDKVEDALVVTTVTYKVASFDASRYEASSASASDYMSVSYALASSGLVVMDEKTKGTTRPASGSLQQAYADFLQAYVAVKNAVTAYQRANDRVKNEKALAWARWEALQSLNGKVKQLDETVDGKNSLTSYAEKMAREKKSLVAFKAVADAANFVLAQMSATAGVIGMSWSEVSDMSKRLLILPTSVSYVIASGIAAGLEGNIADCELEMSKIEIELDKAEYAYGASTDAADIWEEVIAALDDHFSAVTQATEAFAALNAAQEPISKLLQDARAIEEGRELTRQQYANNIAKLRYNDMFFRKMRNAALSQYDAAFALAQKYALLAAKAYAYETGSPLESTEEGRALLRSIVGARALGEVDDDGKPMVAENGDAGLSGILAKLDENWANRKTQLGINNPQPYATWFSLRHGLFRILSGPLGDDAWAKELAKYWVEDIRSDAEFAHYCQPFASQFGLADKEPGLIIPFETTIDFAYNLFGKPLAFDDAQFDSTWYATKISKAGVWFSGYNEKRAGYAGASAFATTPNVYLVPVGTDRMRVPGTDANDEIVGFDVVDQTIPAPYPLTAAEIAEATWFPTYSGETAGADAETRIRRHPSFRAYFGNRDDKPTDAALDAVRLTGRSVWNTRWLLVIPAGALNADRDRALKSFIYGLDTDRDGVIDVKPVSDIKIGFKTYSHGGK